MRKGRNESHRVRLEVSWLRVLCVLTLVVVWGTGCVTPQPSPTPESEGGATPESAPTEQPEGGATPEPPPTQEWSECADFEALTVGQSYHVPDVFSDSKVQIRVSAFDWGNGQWTTDGFAQVDDQGLAGGSGQDLWIDNVNLDFDFCCTLATGLQLKFGAYGGNLNIDINGIFKNFADFADIDGVDFDGVTVVITPGATSDTGTLTLKGEVWSFAIGGQELWIDDVCYSDCLAEEQFLECVDFEDLSLGDEYGVLESFEDSGAVIRVTAFQYGAGQWTTDGFATVTDQGMAGGSGQEMWTNNVNLDFKHLACPVSSMVLSFGAYGGTANIDINGDFKNSVDPMGLDGQIIGGVQVTIAKGAQDGLAKMELIGEIWSFAIGGQELAIDDVCPGP